MSLPPIDPNTWYSLYVNDNNASLLMRTALFNRSGTAGAAFFAKAAQDNSTQHRQLFPTDNTTFVLRTQEGGANSFLGTQPADGKGVISPLMLRGDSLWNGENRTEYHPAKVEKGTGVAMSEDLAPPQNGQRLRWDAGTLLTTRATASSSTTTFPASSASSTNTPAPSSGLSTLAKSGRGATLGLAALIALLVLALFLRCRQRQKQTYKPHDAGYESYRCRSQEMVEDVRTLGLVKHELDHGAASAKYEMPVLMLTEVEARGQQRPVELDQHGVLSPCNPPKRERNRARRRFDSFTFSSMRWERLGRRIFFFLFFTLQRHTTQRSLAAATVVQWTATASVYHRAAEPYPVSVLGKSRKSSTGGLLVRGFVVHWDLLRVSGLAYFMRGAWVREERGWCLPGAGGDVVLQAASREVTSCFAQSTLEPTFPIW
ncbi:hypothetical protein SVAN01_10405 [Stagonosporopsis vannaccii]|nr:hypothetical protein SVAN01_10405 [Stagonosporopsis vannaccii]